MAEGVIELYENFNTKAYPDEIIFGYFNDQPIPSNYYNFLNDDDDNGNNISCNTLEYALLENKGVEDADV